MATIEELEERLNTFEQSLIQMGINQTPVVDKVDSTANRVVINSGDIEVNTANIDYISMMCDIDIPTED